MDEGDRELYRQMFSGKGSGKVNVEEVAQPEEATSINRHQTTWQLKLTRPCNLCMSLNALPPIPRLLHRPLTHDFFLTVVRQAE